MNYLQYFLYFPGMLLLILSTAFITMITGNFKTFILGINCYTSKRYQVLAENQKKAISFFQLLSKTVLGTGAAAFLIHLVAILHTLDDPAMLGPKFNSACLFILYPIVFNLLVSYPIIFTLENKKLS